MALYGLLLASAGIGAVGFVNSFWGVAAVLAASMVLLTPALRALPKESEWRAHAAKYGP